MKKLAVRMVEMLVFAVLVPSLVGCTGELNPLMQLANTYMSSTGEGGSTLDFLNSLTGGGSSTSTKTSPSYPCSSDCSSFYEYLR